MMGFGSSNVNNIGGFAASSSNLSPLAPPFTVDRPTSRSALNINAAPYATPYTWGNSQGCDYHLPVTVSETVTSSLFPSSTVYSVSVSPPVEPRIDHVVYSSSSLTDLFAEYPASLMSDVFGDGDYYAPPSTWDNISVMPQNELGYKSSSALNGIGVTKDNYTQSLYGLQYPSQWDPFCDGRLDIAPGGKNSFLDGIAPELPDCTNASAYRNYLKEGREMPKGLGKSSGGSRVPQINNVSNLQHKPVGSLGTDAVVGKPFPEFSANETYAPACSNIPSRNSGTSFAATPDISMMESWGHFLPATERNVTVHKQHFSNHSPSAPASFHEVTIRRPSVVTSSTISGSLPQQNNVMHDGSDLSGKSDDIVHDRLYNVRDPWLSQRSKQGQEIKKYADTGATSIDPQRYNSSATLFPTKYGDQSGIKNVTSGPLDVFKHEIADKHDNIHNLEGFSLLIDESDQCNPSEDSPCWKGSSSYFSPFQASEAIPSKSRNSEGLILNEPQTFSLSCTIPTTAFSTVFHEKTTYSTNGCLDEAQNLLSSTERGCIGNHLHLDPNIDASHTANKLGATERNSGNGSCFPNDDHRPVEADAVGMESFRVKKPEQLNPIRLCLETFCCEVDKENATACMLNTNVNLNDASEECQSYVPSSAAKQVLSSLSSDADISSKHNQENWDEYATESKSMLLKTIVNLSDSLLFYYLNDENPVGNDDYKILELVLSKLTMCLKFAQEKSSSNECSTRKQGPPNVSNEVQACHDDMANKPHITEAKYHEGSAMLGSSFEGLHKPVRADCTEETGSMIKAIKDILDANFHEDNESYPVATMYKNLWLEAEAVLCSTNYKARYHRMKNRMEKSGSHEEKEKSMACNATPAHMEVFHESSSVGKSAHAADIMTNVEVFQESSSVDKPVHAADIMERYNILKCRAETSGKGIGGELDSSKMSSDQRTVDKLSIQVDCHATYETSIKDANTGCQSHHGPATYVSENPNPSNTSLTNIYRTDMAEDHVMSRLQVLKSRGDYPKSTELEHQPSERSMDSVGKKDCSPVCRGEHLDGRLEPTFEAVICKATVVSSKDGFEGVEGASGSHQPNRQKFAHDSEMAELGVQFSGGWYENTSSDWEHVLKDEFTWTGGAAVNP